MLLIQTCWIGLLSFMFALPSQSPSPQLRLDPSQFEMRLTGEHPRFILGFDESRPSRLRGRFKMDLVGRSNRLKSTAEGEFTLDSVTDRLRIDFPLDSKELTGESEYRWLPWHRIRYRIEAFSGSEPLPILEGVVYLEHVDTDLFEIRLTAPAAIKKGSRFRVWVRVSEPQHNLPRGGVLVRASLDLSNGNDEEIISAEAHTELNGYAVLDFSIPKEMKHSWVHISVVAEKGTFSQAVGRSLQVVDSAYADIQTDKRLYQPGQMLHARALVFDFERRAIGGLPVDFTIWDSQSAAVFRSSAQTSEYGLATLEWKMPADLSPDDYLIEVDSDETNRWTAHSGFFRVGRTNESGFTLRVTTDRSYYLPGQRPQVVVAASYPSGMAVPQGEIRIVRQEGHWWDKRRRITVVEAGEEIAGSTGRKGEFAARLEVDGFFETLADEPRRDDPFHRDLAYDAYFTDSSTGRTEQRRFTVRLVKNEIHIQTIDFIQSPGSSVQFYLKTVYANGEPARCDVHFGPRESDHHRQISTNRFGLAKVSLSSLSSSAAREFSFRAWDGGGKSGRLRRILQSSSAPRIQIDVARTLLKAGKPLEIDVHSPGNGPVLLHVLKGVDVLLTRPVTLTRGSANLTIPYRTDFQGGIELLAFGDDFSGKPPQRAMRAVLYPLKNALEVEVELQRQSSGPGDKFDVSLRVTEPSGEGRRAVLGAIATRETAQPFLEVENDGFPPDWEPVTAGFRLADLLNLPDSARADPELDLLAEVFLKELSRPPLVVRKRSRTLQRGPRNAFSDFFSRHFDSAGVEEALLSYSQSRGGFPGDAEQAEEALKEAGIGRQDLPDPWGNAYEFSFRRESRQFESFLPQERSDVSNPPRKRVLRTRQLLSHLAFRSRGPDLQPGTADDFDAVVFSGIASSHSHRDPPLPPHSELRATESTAAGSLTGRITEPHGAILPGARVHLETHSGTFSKTAISNGWGDYTIEGLPAGTYTVLVEMNGFLMNTTDSVPIRGALITLLDATLEFDPDLGGCRIGDPSGRRSLGAGSVELSAACAEFTADAPLQTSGFGRRLTETLFWEPSLETDADGRAQLRLRLDDTASDWSIRVVASTADGRIGTARTKFRTVRPPD